MGYKLLYNNRPLVFEVRKGFQKLWKSFTMKEMLSYGDLSYFLYYDMHFSIIYDLLCFKLFIHLVVSFPWWIQLVMHYLCLRMLTRLQIELNWSWWINFCFLVFFAIKGKGLWPKIHTLCKFFFLGKSHKSFICHSSIFSLCRWKLRSFSNSYKRGKFEVWIYIKGEKIEYDLYGGFTYQWASGLHLLPTIFDIIMHLSRLCRSVVCHDDVSS